MTFSSKSSHLYSGFCYALAGFTSVLAFVALVEPLRAESDLVAISEREILKRQEDTKLAEQFIITARRDLADKNLEGAYSNYLQALQITRSGPATEKQRTALISEFSKTGIDYANWLISNGRYQDAENTAKRIRDEAKEAARIEVEKAKIQLREALVEEAMSIARKQISSAVTVEDHQRLQADFINHIQAVQK
jgi:hypothetical protein